MYLKKFHKLKMNFPCQLRSAEVQLSCNPFLVLHEEAQIPSRTCTRGYAQTERSVPKACNLSQVLLAHSDHHLDRLAPYPFPGAALRLADCKERASTKESKSDKQSRLSNRPAIWRASAS